ncbi:TlpA family protein disulfide reductase [Actinospica robiniae]|uniref:TlpA family protein disulfide reductase n=1 Tax=Actinospica robiniae TaxID=304901 RepID=UPI000414079B|nr:thioredoxin family protein [Actinospica robiniae]
MNPGLLTALLVLLAASAFGLWRRRTDGRMRPSQTVAAPAAPAEGEAAGPAGPITEPVLGGPLGERATLVQFSSAFCAPCRATRTVLATVASDLDGVTHYDLDAESHLELVRALDIRRTPTTLVLDASGRETARAGGVPRREQVLAAVAAAG